MFSNSPSDTSRRPARTVIAVTFGLTAAFLALCAAVAAVEKMAEPKAIVAEVGAAAGLALIAYLAGRR